MFSFFSSMTRNMMTWMPSYCQHVANRGQISLMKESIITFFRNFQKWNSAKSSELKNWCVLVLILELFLESTMLGQISFKNWLFSIKNIVKISQVCRILDTPMIPCSQLRQAMIFAGLWSRNGMFKLILWTMQKKKEWKKGLKVFELKTKWIFMFESIEFRN